MARNQGNYRKNGSVTCSIRWRLKGGGVLSVPGAPPLVTAEESAMEETLETVLRGRSQRGTLVNVPGGKEQALEYARKGCQGLAYNQGSTRGKKEE